MTEARAAPEIRWSSAEALTGGRPPLVLAPHPDDESLGCGRLLAAAFAGPGAHVVCMTDGAASHPGSLLWPARRLARLRAAELDRAVAELGGGAGDVTRLGLPDGGMEAGAAPRGRLAARIARRARRIGARCLFAPAAIDPHCDHAETAAIARCAARTAGLRLLSYPIWSRWRDPDFRARMPQGREHRLAAGGEAAKRRAVAAHRSQAGRVVPDDPDGFAMPPGFAAFFVEADELYFEERTE
jgi:LmbE family N-acetylglucosaminyl deacetylase